MSATFVAATKALSENPDLLAKVSKAGSAEERATLFTAAGVEVPTHADVNAHIASMADVAGGSGTLSATMIAMDSLAVTSAASGAAAA